MSWTFVCCYGESSSISWFHKGTIYHLYVIMTPLIFIHILVDINITDLIWIYFDEYHNDSLDIHLFCEGYRNHSLDVDLFIVGASAIDRRFVQVCIMGMTHEDTWHILQLLATQLFVQPFVWANQGSLCLCAQPIRDNVTSSLIGCAHSQNNPC